MARPNIKKITAQVEAWNAAHPIGTWVDRYKLMNPRQMLDKAYRTRSLAEVLGGHTAVVWLEGFSGCVALDSLAPLAAIAAALSKPQDAAGDGDVNG